MTFLELRHQVEDALKTSGYSKGTLKSTKCVFNHLQHYLEKGQNFELTHELASQFLLEKNGTLDWDALTKSDVPVATPKKTTAKKSVGAKKTVYRKPVAKKKK